MGEVFGIKSKNDNATTIQMIHPNALIMTIFDFHPNRPPEPLVVGQESAVTYMYIELHASRENWSTESELAGNCMN